MYLYFKLVVKSQTLKGSAGSVDNSAETASSNKGWEGWEGWDSLKTKRQFAELSTYAQVVNNRVPHLYKRLRSNGCAHL